MALDVLGVLQAAATITATTTSTGLNLAQGTPMRGLWACIQLAAISGASTSVAYKIQASADNTTYSDIAVGVPNTATAVGVIDIPFTTNLPYVRLVATAGGTAPVITHSAYIGLGPHGSVVA